MVTSSVCLDSMECGFQRWFASECWEQITKDADAGCIDSIDLMEEISDHLGSLTWHLNNQSEQARIDYEIAYFTQLCDDFEVA